MSRKDKILQEIGILREKRKDLFTALLALFSGLCIVVYAVVSGEKPPYVMFLALIGVILTVYLSVNYQKLIDTLDEKLDELEKEE